MGYSVYAIHRVQEYFGGDVDEFRPERCIKIKPKTAYMPFHAGPRTCLGRKFIVSPRVSSAKHNDRWLAEHLSLCLAKYSTVRLLQYFEFVENRNVEPWQEKLGLNCTSLHGVKVGLTASNPAQ